MASLIAYTGQVPDFAVPCLVINLVDPLVDAGDVAQLMQAAVDSLESVSIASFDHDMIYDFRAQRPMVAYKDGRLVDLEQPRMMLDLVTDIHGDPFLYLWGQEPDFRWNSLTCDILDIVQRFGVTDVYSYAGMPAGVPHTRPADMVIRATARTDVQYVPGEAQHFSQLHDFFEYHAGKAGVSVTNLRVRVPFYMAKGPHPYVSGALALLKMTASLGGPTLPLGDLEQLEDQQLRELSTMVEDGSEFAELLKHLEEEYDQLPSNAGVTRPVDRIPEMPSADEIARAAEHFLATLSHDPLKQVHGDGENTYDNPVIARELDKGKDASEKDYSPENQAPSPASSLRASIVKAMRRGKHHKPRND